MRIGILGAGISGLTLAWELSRKHDVIVFEKSDRVGGWLQTEQVGPFLFERGPRTFKTSSSPELLKLAADLELAAVPCSLEAKKRYLWQGGRLKSLLSWRHLLPFLREWSVAPHPEEETIWEFACRRFNRTIAETFFDPLTLGIYGGDLRKLSMNACFPLLKEWEQKHGSLTKAFFKQAKRSAQAPLFSFEKGVHSLVRRLSEESSAKVHFNCAATALHFFGDVVEIVTEKGTFDVDLLFSALPAHALGKLLNQELAELLLQIEHLSLTVISLGYQEKVFSKKGFGYLIPSHEQEEILGCVFDSIIFPQMGTCLTVMVRGVEKSDTAYLEIAERSLKKQLQILSSPDCHLITRTEHSIPQYTLGHSSRMHRLLAKCPERLRLTGNYLSGVSVNECIARARKTAKL